MIWTLVEVAGVPAQPWKNGGGVTRELLAWPSTGNWSVRISAADVAKAGPFSTFAGVNRWFAVLSGEGVDLEIDGAVHRVTRDDDAIAFSGEARVDCRLLHGATLDLNLMTRGSAGRMTRVRGASRFAVGATTLVAAFASASEISLDCNGVIANVPAGVLAWTIPETEAQVQVTGEHVLWMEVAP